MAPDAARAAAADLIMAALAREAAVGEEAPALAGLAAPARARALRLARMTLRHLDRADRLLERHLRRPPPPESHAILRLATVEMMEGGTPLHAGVDAAVTLARKGGEGQARLVNAVLRRIAATSPADWAALPPQRLPGWLRGRLSSAYGNATVARIEAVHAAAPPLDLTPRDGDAPALARAVSGRALATGSVRLPPGTGVAALPGYGEGAFWVQDAAAALPARLIGARPEMRVLDLCAAPGGKTMQLAATGAGVTALDISPARLDRLRANLARTGLSAELMAADAREFDPGHQFDAVLLDAPCTATGTIRRHPEIQFQDRRAMLKRLAGVQAELIDRALALTRPGGLCVYCTCSLLPEEGEAQIAAALMRHPGLVVRPPELAGLEARWRDSTGALRIRPDHWAEPGGIDGFYIAVLITPGA